MPKSTTKSKEYLKSILKDKRGSLQDVIFGGAYLLKIAVTIIIAVFVWISFQSLMASTIAGKSSETILTSVMATLTSAYFSIDYMFPFIVGGLLLISTIFAYKTGANILLGIISFVLWLVAVVLSILFVNVYITVTNQFPTLYVSFPIMDTIMSNLHFVTLGWLAIITLVMFRKTDREDQSQISRFYGM
jgi:hypothetical protein